ncbi:hypothetical protein ACTJIJ_09425 [Niabella sp. 22666]|uniref:hypothetical protein n=1 Tax=Niabella sp. 22666 TaxID=3453954 RepID=UPI003F831C11
MNYKHDIIIILDSILDDYYFLWECYEEYKQISKSEGDCTTRFSEALKYAYENKYFDFFIGESFNGDEELIPDFDLTKSIIEKLLDYEYSPVKEIRVTTSKLGVEFLKGYHCS